jgi:hypothetical protein
MSRHKPKQGNHSRWIDWRPTEQIMADSAKRAPTKPSKPGFVGFVGATSGDSRKIAVAPDTIRGEPAQPETDRATGILNRAEVRIMRLTAISIIGVWSDLDGPEVRAALRTLQVDRLPVRYVDGNGFPVRFKVRRVAGEPVPMNVLNEMERQPGEPWKVRDRMLKQMGSWPKGIGWAEWQAAELNRLFQEQGVTRQTGRITAATVRHGQRKPLAFQRQTGTAAAI